MLTMESQANLQEISGLLNDIASDETKLDMPLRVKHYSPLHESYVRSLKPPLKRAQVLT
jgi:hypothetical protein